MSLVRDPLESSVRRRFSLALAATFTVDPIVEVLDLWAHELSLDPAVEIAPYNQVLQQLLDPTSLFSLHRAGLNVAFVRLEDWDVGGDARGGSAAEGVDLAPGAGDLLAAVQTALARGGSPLLLCFCPSSPATRASGRAALFDRTEAFVAAALADTDRAFVVTSSELAALYPVSSFHDAHGDALGHIPYTPAQFAALGTLVARRAEMLTGAPYKVIVADCDQTLWTGVAAEDGPLGVTIDAPRRLLQERLVQAHDAGMLICLCSKNEDADVVAVFDAHPEMPLQLHHLTARRVNYERKSHNLRALAAELGVGLDSFVFVDDSPLERAEVRAACPEVLTAELPGDPALFSVYLRHLWALDRAAVTAEDRQRSTFYRAEQRRDAARREGLGYEEFLQGLCLEVDLVPLTEATLSRAAQLTQRTNQLNLTTRRRTEAELVGVEGLVVSVRDRFGDYGLVGLLLFATAGDALAVDTFLLSCRALGRGVEERMLAQLGRLAEERGLERVDVPLVPTAKNRPAQELFEAVGAPFREQSGEGALFRFPASHLASARISPVRQERERVESDNLQPVSAGQSSAPEERAALLNRIAGELSDPPQIVAAVRAYRRRSRAAASSASTPLMGPIEETLAAIWKQVLHVESVGAADNFLEIGGNSVSLVQVVSRIRDAFQIELPPPVFFAGPTVRELGRALADPPAPSAAPGEMDELLALVEGLSADEVEALLQQSAATAAPTVATTRPPRAVEIAQVCLVTANRPGALARALESYLDNRAQHGRTNDFVVVDDSPGADTREAARSAIASLAAARGATVSYAGRDEKEAFVSALVARGLPASTVRFALLPESPRDTTVGANRNALLLHTVGSAILSVDDDTLCRIAAAPQPARGLRAIAGRDPADYWFFSDREAALRGADFVDRDLLAMHEELLGQEVPSVLSSHGAACEGDPALLERLAARGGAVRMTFNGFVGDCGWGAPFGHWFAPMGYLAMEGASRRRLTASETAYQDAVTSRQVLRVVDRPHLGDASFSMTMFAGLDNRGLLPPFCPVGRGEDLVFGALLTACLPDDVTGHLPWALVHAPIESRRFWTGEMSRTASSVDASRILIECIRSAARDEGARSPEARMRALGAHLKGLGALPRGDFEAHVRERLSVSNQALVDRLGVGLSSAPPWWVDDVERYLAELAKASKRDDYPVALDLSRGRTADEARTAMQELARRFGELLVSWPDLVACARELRERGAGLAVTLRA
jgi:FkbH-like protein